MPARGLEVALQENVKFEPKGKEIRGVSRLNSRVRVAIECTEAGQTVRAEGYTKDISAKGCLAVVPHGFAVGQKVRIINLVNQNASDAYFFWQGYGEQADLQFFPDEELPPAMRAALVARAGHR